MPLADFSRGRQPLQGRIQLVEVEEVGAGAAAVDDPAVFANQIQALRSRTVSFIDGVVHLFHQSRQGDVQTNGPS